MEGKARGRGRDAARQAVPPSSGRRPGNGRGGGGRGGQPGPSGFPQQQQQQQQQGQKQPPQAGSSSNVGRGAGSQPVHGGGPRYGTPSGAAGGEGRAALHRVIPSVAPSVPSASGGGDGNGASVVTASTRSAESKEGRGAIRGRRVISDILVTRPKQLQSKKGARGDSVLLQTNYIRVLKKPSWSVYQYRVDFAPEVVIDGLRKRLVYEQKATLGGYIFDGTVIFNTIKLPRDQMEFMSKDRDGNPIQMIIKYVGEISPTNMQFLQVLNLILRRAVSGLKLQLVGRNYFDALAKIDLPQYNMQLWPGYITSIRQHEADIMVCTELATKVMRTENLLDIIEEYRRNDRNYVKTIELNLMGMTVLTDYNNKTYRIDSIDFAQTPAATFETRDGPTSFAQYYLKKYNIKIKNMQQPLLISKSKARDIRAGQSEFVALIPELCRATGITEQMRSNFQLTRAMSEHTRLGPDLRIKKLLQFNSRLETTPDSMAVLNEWNVGLDRNLVEVNGRILPIEKIYFGDSKSCIPKDADWTRELVRGALFAPVPITRWTIIFPPRCSREVNDFLDVTRDVAKGFRLQMSEPTKIEMSDDRQGSYSTNIDKALNNDPQIVVVVLLNNNADKYSNIKKKCCVDRAVPTQVVTAKTITPKRGNPPRSIMSIVTKIVIQMECKLGGAPWMVHMPVNGLMTIGYDVCHDTRDKSKSYGAMVATMDLNKQVKYFSTVNAHTRGQELSDFIPGNIYKACAEYRRLNNTLPDRMILYRDGVGDGQINYVFEREVDLVYKKLQEIYETAGQPVCKFAFIIVSKRINTRLFLKTRNPPPGTVVDDVITLPERYDFYLVSQSVRQGTVSPTSYNIIFDTFGLAPEHMQVLTYKMTHLYYNWSGTTRVPAVCQYAHKLAFLVGQYLHQSPSNIMDKDLYFL